MSFQSAKNDRDFPVAENDSLKCWILLVGNILIEGKTNRVKLIDFGLSAYCRGKKRLTEIVGTVAYMVSCVVLRLIFLYIDADF